MKHILFSYFLFLSTYELYAISSLSQCDLNEFQTCMGKQSPPSSCASSSGCEGYINDMFAEINSMTEPVIFKYTANPHVVLTSEDVSYDTLDHDEFRNSSPHFPLSRPFTVSRKEAPMNHNVSMLMPTYFSEEGACAKKHLTLVSLANYVPGDYPFARVETCQTMVLTSVCLCFVNMHTEAGRFVVTSKTKHPLSTETYQNDLRRLAEVADQSNKASSEDSGAAASDVSKTSIELSGNSGIRNDVDIDFITHSALVILTVVAFVGNGLFLTYVFCISAV